MNSQLICHIKDILSLREQFSRKSGIHKEAETFKIWARWIITHRSLFPQDHIYLPSDSEYDFQILTELQMKGCPKDKQTYEWLLSACADVNQRYPKLTLSETEFPGIHGNIPVYYQETGTGKSRQAVFSCGDFVYELPMHVVRKLDRLYVSTGLAMPSMKNEYIWLITALYDLLDGKGLQWAVPATVMWLLQQDLGCYTELFASPINTYNSSYYSLFSYDRYFGSKGNFFTAPNSDFVEGAYQINPPFIIPLFTKTTERVLELLEIAEQNEKLLTFVYIMPEWDDFPAYNMVSETRFCMKQIKMDPGRHYYHQYSTGSYIKARFGTHIIFLSTDMKCCNNEFEKAIKVAFSQPFKFNTRTLNRT